MNFKDRLKELISQSGTRPSDVARATGVSAESLSRYLKGLRFPRGETLIVLANFFNVDPNWLLTGEKAERRDRDYDFLVFENKNLKKFLEEKQEKISLLEKLVKLSDDKINLLEQKISSMSEELTASQQIELRKNSKNA